MSPKLLAGLLIIAACDQVLAATPIENITYQGAPYKLSNSATCPNGNVALRVNSAYYCKVFSATLKWTIPASRVDGKGLPIGELAGYQIYYTSDNPANSGIYTISGGSSSNYAAQLFGGNYYFTISAIDIFGTKSSMSNLVSIKLGP